MLQEPSFKGKQFIPIIMLEYLCNNPLLSGLRSEIWQVLAAIPMNYLKPFR